MTDIVERLRKLSRDMLSADIDMKLPAGSVDPSEAADEIERLRAKLGALRDQEPVALGVNIGNGRGYHTFRVCEMRKAKDYAEHCGGDVTPLYALKDKTG